jgi:hypothetical protein
MKALNIIFIACACMLLQAGTSLADPAKAAILIDNPSGKAVTYQYRWGSEGPWKIMKLNSGFHVTHTKNYNPMGVPPLSVLFEQFSTFDGGASKTYKLTMGWDNNPRRYHFNVRNNKLDLFTN